MKNYRKLFAWLMTVIMLLGMVPTAHAELAGCNHDWSIVGWLNGAPENCQERKTWRNTCTICGANDDFERVGSCVPGSKTWVRPQGSTCLEYGVWEICCQLCGEWMDGREEPGPHNWVTRTVEEPTCTYPGYKETVCSVCESEQGKPTEIPALGHNWGPDKVDHPGNCQLPALHSHMCTRCNTREEWDGEYSDHSWGAWQVDKAATCTEGGTEKRTCSVCSKTESRNTDALGHSYGSWKDDTKPTCTERGLQYKKCSRCGDTEWRYKAKIDHNFGEWYVVTPAQVGVAGLEQRDCTYGCGTNEQREIPPLEEVAEVPVSVNLEGLTVTKSAPDGSHNKYYYVGEVVPFTITVTNNTGMELVDVEITDPIKGSNEDAIVDRIPTLQPGESVSVTFNYTVTEADAAIGTECFDNIAYATGYTADGTQVSGTSNKVRVWCVIPHEVTLTKTVGNEPANGEYFVPGELIEFKVYIKNETPYPLYCVTLTDPLCEDQHIYDEVNDMSYIFFDDLSREGAGGDTIFDQRITLDYIVTEADAEAGFVTNTAYVNYMTWYGEEKTASASVTAQCGYDNSGDFGLSGALSITKSVTNTPANGMYYVPGEAVTFEVFVKHVGAPLDQLMIYDWMFDVGSHAFGTITNGETVSFDISYTVTNLDAAYGSVSNIAHAEAVDANGNWVVEYSNNVTVPCGYPEGDAPFGVLTGLEVTKEVESLPLNGLFYQDGETVAYKITYTNSGETVLTDVMIFDALAGFDEIASAEMLQPDESRVCYVNYTVTYADTVAGSIANTAIGQYQIGDYINTVTSNTVVVPANGFTVHQYTPGTPEEPGNIDPGKLPQGKSSCLRTITGKDNTSASYEISFCADHVAAQSTVLMMKQAATTPETQLQTAAYAVALWRSEVEKLYQTVLEAADNRAKMNIMTEYIRFLTEVANYEAMLKVLRPDQPAVVAQKIADIWENKCVALCYEIHTAVDQRKDSLLSVTAATGATAADCICAVTAESAGTKTYTQCFCATHAFPFGMIDMMLQGKNTAEGWTMIRQIWTVELNSAYNKVNTLLGDSRELALAEFAAMTQWMTAREAYLTALYPNNPEVVAQTMVKVIMDRVSDLCMIGK